MYGVPIDLPLASFLGEECNRIGLGRFQLQFHFSGGNRSISTESKWEIRDENDAIIDQAMPHAQRKEFRVHLIIDQLVRGYEINPPLSFTLRFENGYSLTIYDDSKEYESFSLHTDGHAYYI